MLSRGAQEQIQSTLWLTTLPIKGLESESIRCVVGTRLVETAIRDKMGKPDVLGIQTASPFTAQPTICEVSRCRRQ